MQLRRLVAPIPDAFWHQTPCDAGEIEIRGLSFDSRSVRPGDLFFALPGRRVNGAAFLDEAWARGAAAAVLEGPAACGDAAHPVLAAVSARQVMGLCSALYHGEPSRKLRVLSVTGTDGKTSTVWFARHILARAGRRTRTAGTLGLSDAAGATRAWVAGTDATPAREPARTWRPTTPESPLFQKTLAEWAAEGVEDVLIEVSSHALAQERVFGTQFRVAALTHVSADHLDFHKTHEEYLAAKAKLFAPASRGGPLEREPVTAVINVDDAFGRALVERGVTPLLTYGTHPQARMRRLSAEVLPDGMVLAWVFEDRSVRCRVPLRGEFHAANLTTAAAIAWAAGIDPAAIGAALEDVTPVPGRFETIDGGQDFAVIVDYAHTADGLANLLRAARRVSGGALTLVFGCGGDRDRGKRPAMGRIAGALADRVIVTTDNPRSEDPQAIAAEIVAGLAGASAVWEVILDRREALARALECARRGDVVVATGKGAEGLQIYRDRVDPFDDRQVLRALLAARHPRPRASGGATRAAPVATAAADPWCLAEIARMTEATVAGISPEDWKLVSSLVASGVDIDSRAIVGGEVFVALPGANADGHGFIAAAFDNGAAAAVARRDWWGRRRAARARGIHLLVDDPLPALSRWAAALRRRIGTEVIAITGSSGKTTTKEMTLALWREHGPVVGTLGNRNNQIGLPWTLLQLRPERTRAVVELGANHPGEIAPLSRIAAPQVAVITRIGHAHLGEFGSAEAVLAAKLEILEGLAPDGAVVIPDNDARLEEALAARWSGRVVRFGQSERADVRATGVDWRLDGTELRIAGREAPIALRLLGQGAVSGALASLAVMRALGIAEIDVAPLARLEPLPGRLDPRRSRGVTWLLDMYNASPESTLANLELLARAPVAGRRVFVFGGMRELGLAGEAWHAEIGRAAGFCDAGVFIGEEARAAAPEAQKAGVRQVVWGDDPRSAVRFLRDYLRPGDAVLLKGARAARLEQIAESLGVIDAAYGTAHGVGRG